jgi:hypothetical protein
MFASRLPYVIEVLFPLLEERTREREGCSKTSVYIYSPTLPE